MAAKDFADIYTQSPKAAVLQSTCKDQYICDETLEGLDYNVVFKD